ncbi:hypothetical protein F5876DRAFT_64280 [Lentinula aff. lateritia]|uniref:Uncharacterized protein n=1 Tax=Lentinula aff. lateritia TaxID=2804960 RepID=A0ACC1U4X7_9AGAR|nr:hypothetical protein F5876DRAFT_64280 [Lentinula aff. lateritia]
MLTDCLRLLNINIYDGFCALQLGQTVFRLAPNHSSGGSVTEPALIDPTNLSSPTLKEEVPVSTKWQSKVCLSGIPAHWFATFCSLIQNEANVQCLRGSGALLRAAPGVGDCRAGRGAKGSSSRADEMQSKSKEEEQLQGLHLAFIEDPAPLEPSFFTQAMRQRYWKFLFTALQNFRIGYVGS